jgi:hypothetical protein
MKFIPCFIPVIGIYYTGISSLYRKMKFEYFMIYFVYQVIAVILTLLFIFVYHHHF